LGEGFFDGFFPIDALCTITIKAEDLEAFREFIAAEPGG